MNILNTCTFKTYAYILPFSFFLWLAKSKTTFSFWPVYSGVTYCIWEFYLVVCKVKIEQAKLPFKALEKRQVRDQPTVPPYVQPGHLFPPALD